MLYLSVWFSSESAMCVRKQPDKSVRIIGIFHVFTVQEYPSVKAD